MCFAAKFSVLFAFVNDNNLGCRRLYDLSVTQRTMDKRSTDVFPPTAFV